MEKVDEAVERHHGFERWEGLIADEHCCSVLQNPDGGGVPARVVTSVAVPAVMVCQ
jgi:hypothetical protein